MDTHNALIACNRGRSLTESEEEDFDLDFDLAVFSTFSGFSDPVGF